LAIANLHRITSSNRRFQLVIIKREIASPDSPQIGQLVVVEVGLLALGEAKQKHRSVAAPISDNRAISAALALTRPCGSLLDQPAAQVRIYKSASTSPRSALAMALPSILSVIPSRRWGDI
jgi:hypothetical protein